MLCAADAGWVPLLIDSAAPPPVRHGVSDFCTDARETTGSCPAVLTVPPLAGSALLIAGVWGESALLAGLVERGCLAPRFAEGIWDAFEIHPVTDPYPGVGTALVIVGGNARGTMYGLYAVSERALGTDPMKLWTDYRPELQAEVSWNWGTMAEGPPAVHFRGIFVNDEDALLGWIGQPEDQVLEPEIQAMIAETASRLRANLLAPPMWGGYLDPAMERLLEDRALYFTACHYEIMLANPLNYWAAWCRREHGQEIPYSFTLHPEAVKNFWRDSALRNRHRLCVWQVGLRGLTDCPFWETDPGAPEVMAERASVLTAAIESQIEILHECIPPGREVIATLTMRSEVLEMFRTGRLTVPDEVILVWDDQARTSIIRELPDSAQQSRSGGHGVYYHLTFCQNPRMAYLPPALIQSELLRAVNAGADRYALLNVGNLREVSLSTQLGMDLIWNTRSAQFDPNWASRRIAHWLGRRLGPAVSMDVARLYEDLVRAEYGFRVSQVTDSLGPLITSRDIYPVWDNTSAIDACVGRDPASALREYAGRIDFSRPPARCWLFSRENLAEHLKPWDELMGRTECLRSRMTGFGLMYFNGCIAVQVATGWAFAHWGYAVMLGFDCLREGDFAGAALHLEEGATWLDRLECNREQAAQGRWINWFRGEYHNAFRQSLWTLKPRWHAEDTRRLAELARAASEG
jgi:hypothetical protein